MNKLQDWTVRANAIDSEVKDHRELESYLRQIQGFQFVKIALFTTNEQPLVFPIMITAARHCQVPRGIGD